MGQSAGLIIGAAAAVVGGILSGGSLLAVEAGFMIGSMLGSLLFPPKKPTPADVRVQDSAYGKWIPMVWGRYRMAGNIIWAGTPHEQDGGGKGMGGGKGGNQPYVTMSFAVGLCEGVVDAVTRIWANGKLIYDISNPEDFQALSGSSQMITGWTLYPGDEFQVADPIMESQQGVGNVPAYRGLCYVVFNELNLQQWGNYLPSLSFEVIRDANPVPVVTGQINYTPSPAGGANQNALGTQITPAGVVYGWSWGVSGSLFALTAFQLTQYGTVYQTEGTFLNGGPIVSYCYSYDEPGAATTDGKWLTNSGLVSNIGISLGLLGATNGSAIKRGGVVYLSLFNGVGPLYITTPVPLGFAPLSLSVVQFAMKVVGVTDNFVYVVGVDGSDATYGNRLVKFDLEGNFIAILDHNTSLYTFATVGSTPSDTELFFLSNTVSFVYQFNGTTSVPTDIANPFGANVNGFVVVPGAQAAYFSNTSSGFTFYASVTGQYAAPVTVADIIDEVCTRAGLLPGQFSAATLTDNVIGYANTNNSSSRDILTPLLATFFVDVSDSDGQLKFVRRGATPTLTIPWDDLGADTKEDSDQSANPIYESIIQEFELPRSETVSYVSSTTDYQTATQRAFMGATTSNLDESVNLSIVLADNDARVRVEAMLWERWSKRKTYKFSTSYKYLALEPSDVVNIQGQTGQLYPVRITGVDLDGKGVMSYQADFTVPQIYPNPGLPTYVAQGGNSLGFRKQVIDYSGPTIMDILDLPPLRPQDASSAGVYVAGAGFDNTWPGAVIDISRDDVNFSQSVVLSNASVMGLATTVLGAFNGGNLVDELNTVTVQLYNSSQGLSSVSYASLINGANAAVIGSELVYFRSAVQINANTWRLSGFLRGRVGTGAAEATHALGDIFVLLDPSVLGAASLNTTDIGQTLYFEAYLRNIFGGTPGGVQTIAPANARLAPLTPYQLTAGHGTSHSASDISVQWFRSARVNYNWYDGVDIPLDWSQESYCITILNSSGVQLNQYTLTSTGITWNGGAVPNSVPSNPINQALPPFIAPTKPVFGYSAAMITNDGVTTGQSITIKVQQIGDFGVQGGAATTTITR